MKQYSEFTYWFKFVTKGVWHVYKKGECIDCIDEHCDIFPDYLSDWEEFKHRPEYCVGAPIKVEGVDQEELIEKYENLLKGISRIRSANHEDERSAIAAATWLQSTDFYHAPASTKYHGSFPCGLLCHSIDVYNQAISLMSLDKFYNAELDVADVALCALTHDWCKIGMYETYKKNVKDEVSGKWHTEEAYRVNPSNIPLGHGVSSMFIASKFFKLNPPEASAIRWHMGTWRVCDAEMDELQRANEIYPLVHLIQFADQLSIVNY